MAHGLHGIEATLQRRGWEQAEGHAAPGAATPCYPCARHFQPLPEPPPVPTPLDQATAAAKADQLGHRPMMTLGGAESITNMDGIPK